MLLACCGYCGSLLACCGYCAVLFEATRVQTCNAKAPGGGAFAAGFPFARVFQACVKRGHELPFCEVMVSARGFVYYQPN